MNINFLGPVLPTDRFGTDCLRGNPEHHPDREQHHRREQDDHRTECQSRFRLPVGTFPVVILGQPFHAVATDGVQFSALFQPTHLQYPFRNAGEP